MLGRGGRGGCGGRASTALFLRWRQEDMPSHYYPIDEEI